MPWFKVDDGFAFHPKAIEAGNAALGLWVRAGAWCGANLTDGALPRHMIRTFGAQARDARRLVAVGLWVETDTGYQFHGWGDMQPTKADVEAERADNRARQKAYRDRKRNNDSNSVSNGVTHSATNGAPTRPDPLINKEASEVADATPRPDLEELLDLMDDCLKQNGAKTPSRTKKNRDAARLLIDRDGYTQEQIAWMIRWATGHEFWRQNILSMSKLREKFDQLKLQATDNKQTHNFNGDINPEKILGPDYWSCPDPPPGLTMDEERDWRRQQRANRKAERIEQAKQQLRGNHAAAV